ncbi:MAG: chorismate mutase [Phycisphaerae bacterium]|mgnify:CR=1 FL=1|nr:chorismate mutase [Phycisphaerae bacterium]MAT80549.1 chorismate mutase [Phycisphaerae bacterium]|tara:strand:+ start:1213 stop:2295 length:1083 start_codon:yes stop_codon:yes gene_type:complete
MTGPIDIQELRKRIDEIDARLLELLNERAQVVVSVGETKRDNDTPIYAPHRERQVLDKVLKGNVGPLPDRTIEAIWRELMSGSFRLERGVTIGYLGPSGSFSHVAAVRHFGSSVEFMEFEDISAVFREVMAGNCTYGLVPYENSTGGSITDTLDAFSEFKVTVYAEALISISHCLLSNIPMERIRRIASKPQVFSQCRQWLDNNLPKAERVDVASSSAAVLDAAVSDDLAAIGSRLAGKLHGVNILSSGIEDNPGNITRFLVIARERARPTGQDRTSIMFTTSHEPGALVDVLAVFRDAGINLSHIDKRPSGHENWSYSFFIDADAHQEDPVMAEALETARKLCRDFAVLGSYPKAEQVL